MLSLLQVHWLATKFPGSTDLQRHYNSSQYIVFRPWCSGDYMPAFSLLILVFIHGWMYVRLIVKQQWRRMFSKFLWFSPAVPLLTIAPYSCNCPHVMCWPWPGIWGFSFDRAQLVREQLIVNQYEVVPSPGYYFHIIITHCSTVLVHTLLKIHMHFYTKVICIFLLPCHIQVPAQNVR